MNRLTSSQQSAMIKAHKQGPVVAIRAVTANALIDAGYLRRAPGWNFPTGIACMLTDKGREWINT